MKQPSEDTLRVPIRRQQPGRLGQVLQKMTHALNQCPIYGVVSPTARIHRSSNQGDGNGNNSTLYQSY